MTEILVEDYSNRITTLKVTIATLESEIMSLEQEKNRVVEQQR